MGKKRRHEHKMSDRSDLLKEDSTAIHTGSTRHGVGALKFTFAALIVFLIYSNTWHSPFVFDDLVGIEKNPHIRLTSLSGEGAKKVDVLKGPSSQRPVANISFALNYYFHRYNVPGYHLVNILIHVATGLFLYLFLKITLNLPSLYAGDESYQWIAFFTVLIWLVHPIQTQSVNYIVQRMNIMAAMFYILALLLYVKARQATRHRKKRLLFAGCLLSGILSLGSKEIAATLPFFIFLYEWFFFQDLSRSWLKRRILPVAGMLMIVCLVALIYLGADPLKKIGMTYKDFDFTLSQRVLTEFRVVIFYLSLLIFPHPSRLNLDHDFPLSYSLIDPITTLTCMGFITAMVGLAVLRAKKDPLLSFCILWFLGNLVIESSVIGLDLLFEHRLYLPSMLLILLALITAHRYVNPRGLGVGILCAVGMMFSIWTYERNSVWGDDEILWRDCLKKSPKKVRIHYNLGNALMRKGRLDEAVIRFAEALHLEPGYSKAHNNLGNALMRQGKLEEAMGHYADALRIKPEFAEAHYNLGNGLARLGRLEDAMSHYTEAIRNRPDYVKAHNNLGLSLASLGRIDEAIGHYDEALRIKPDDAEALNNLGIALVRQRRMEEAVHRFTEALRIRPDFSEARQNLKRTLMRMNKSRAVSRMNQKP